MRMTEALRQVAENVQEMKKDRTGNPTTMKDAEKEAVKKAVSKIKSTGMSYSDWEKTTTFGPRLKQAVKMQVEEVDLDEEAFKPDDIVIPKIGPHKGKKHRIIAVKSDNRYTIAPVDIPARLIQYRLGAATANASDLTKYVKEDLDEEWIDVEEAFKPDDIVIPKIGPHKGKKHRIIAVKSDNRYTIAPVDIPARSIQYRLGAATANASDLTKYVKEDLDEEAFKPDDIVIPKIGPHKGKKHRIIAVKSDNRYTIAPVDIPVRSIQYRLGATTANASDLTKYVKEDLDEEWIDVEEAVNMLEEGKSSTGYDLYHKDFSSAMQHAYDFAKKKYGITIDPEEIDSKVATGPKKPSEGKTNSYSLKGDKGIVQIQVYNKGGSKPYELNMYKS
jgi:transcription antitermination factor NusG